MPMADRINTRIDTNLKKKALKVFDRLDLSEAEPIRLFYAQVELNQGIPFPVKIAATLAAFEETNTAEKLPSYKNFRALRDRAGRYIVLTVKPTNRFLRDLKLAKNRGVDLDKLEAVVDL